MQNLNLVPGESVTIGGQEFIVIRATDRADNPALQSKMADDGAVALVYMRKPQGKVIFQAFLHDNGEFSHLASTKTSLTAKQLNQSKKDNARWLGNRERAANRASDPIPGMPDDESGGEESGETYWEEDWDSIPDPEPQAEEPAPTVARIPQPTGRTRISVERAIIQLGAVADDDSDPIEVVRMRAGDVETDWFVDVPENWHAMTGELTRKLSG